MAAYARQLIADHPMVGRFCEPCGDRVPGEPERATRVPDDLAYAYIQTSPHRYDNLAALVGCPTVGVSPSLRVEEAPDRGVLILPDSSEPAAIPQMPALPAAPVELAPTVIVQSTISDGLGWSAIAAGCGGTALLWLVALRLRRRRTHRPRLG